MKKVMFLAVLALLLVSLFSVAVPALADDGDNLKEAGQQALQEREELLAVKKAAIEFFVQRAAQDRVVTGEEMLAFCDMVEDFNQLKTKSDNYLKVYGLATFTNLKAEYNAAVSEYLGHDALFKEDDGTVKKFFAIKTGKDVIIERKAVIDAPVILLIFLCALFLFFAIVGFCSKKADDEAAGLVSLCCVVVSLIILFCV